MPEGREIANQTFVHKKSKYAAVTITMAALVLLTGYSLFMKYRQTLDLNRFGKIVEVLTDNSDLILAVLLLVFTVLPVYFVFDRRRAQARDLVPVAFMAALCVAGRAAFAVIPLPNFKPVSAIIIITGISFGPECGYLTGALAGFLSNFLFGQGPWTPWQMFCWGMIGLLSGILYRIGIFGSVGRQTTDRIGKRKKPVRLCIFGFLCGIGYGWVMNLYYLIGYVDPLNVYTVAAAYASSLLFDISHGVCTAMVLWFVGDTWTRKLLRIRRKFGIAGGEEG